MQPLDDVVDGDVRWCTCEDFGSLSLHSLENELDNRGRFARAWRSMDHTDVLGHEAFADGFSLRSVETLIIEL